MTGWEIDMIAMVPMHRVDEKTEVYGQEKRSDDAKGWFLACLEICAKRR